MNLIKYIVIIILSWGSIAIAEEPILQEIYSENGQYQLTISNFKTCTLHHNDQILWQETIDDLLFTIECPCAKPLVSDQGTVVLVKDTVMAFYNRQGDLISKFPNEERPNVFFQKIVDCSCGDRVHQFSGNDYYLFASRRDLIIFIALNELGEEQWHLSMGRNSYSFYRAYPFTIQTSKNRIIIDDFIISSPELKNRCLLLNRENGQIIAEYSIDENNGITRPILDEETNSLFIYDMPDIKSYNIQTGKLTKTLHQKDLISFLMTDQIDKLIFALSILKGEPTLVQFNTETIQRLEELTKMENQKIKKFSQELLIQLNQH